MKDGSQKTEDRRYGKFKFEKLLVWQRAMDLGEDINQVSLKLPKEETYNLAQQIRRAADSVALNIAEGAVGQTGPEFRKFLNYAIRSLAETVSCLHKIKRRDYISEDTFRHFYEGCFNLMNMLIGLKRSIGQKSQVDTR
jgi:four helix bundle protein